MSTTAEIIFRSKTGSLVWICLLIGVLAFSWPQWFDWPTSAWKTMVVYSVAGSFVASSIFTTIYVVFSNDQLLDVIREGARSAVLDSWDPAQRFVPISDYPANKNAGESFNAALRQSILPSRTFLFRGATALHAVARIEALETHFTCVKIMIHDPRDRNLLRWRASHSHILASKARRSKVKIAADEGMELAVTELMNSMQAGLFGLFNFARHRADVIEVVIVKNPYLDRFEMTDEALFFQPFNNEERGKSEYPPAYMFSSRSLIYDHLSREFDIVAKHDSSYVEKIFPNSTKNDFDVFMNKLFPDSWSAESQLAAQNRFTKLVKEYRN